MKRADVRVGEAYAIRIQKQECRVRIESARSNGGWDATNLATGKTVRIKSPSGLKALPAAAEGGHGGEVSPIVAESAVEAKVPESAEPAVKKLSAIDAAARVLAEAGTPMNAKQMIEAMTAKEYWTSPAGKTPQATLYSAIIREIAVKGETARFTKTARGTFTARS